MALFTASISKYHVPDVSPEMTVDVVAGSVICTDCVIEVALFP